MHSHYEDQEVHTCKMEYFLLQAMELQPNILSDATNNLLG